MDPARVLLWVLMLAAAGYQVGLLLALLRWARDKADRPIGDRLLALLFFCPLPYLRRPLRELGWKAFWRPEVPLLIFGFVVLYSTVGAALLITALRWAAG